MVKPWVELPKKFQPRQGAAENMCVVLSVAPAGACGFDPTKPMADAVDYFLPRLQR
jgi:hypothetical protein